VLFPLLLLVLAEISLESLLSPRTVDRVGNRRERGNGLVFSRVLEKLAESVSKSRLHYVTSRGPTSVRAP
jgi:hypothetical protein